MTDEITFPRREDFSLETSGRFLKRIIDFFQEMMNKLNAEIGANVDLSDTTNVLSAVSQRVGSIDAELEALKQEVSDIRNLI